MTAEPIIQQMIDKFQRRMDKDPEAKAEVAQITKTLNIDLGEEAYSLKLENATVSDFKPELLADADITIVTTAENLEKLLDGSLRPMKAYVTKKIVIKGKIQDIMFLKKFF